MKVSFVCEVLSYFSFLFSPASATLLVGTGAALNILHPHLARCRGDTSEAKALAGFGGGTHKARIWKNVPLTVGTLDTHITARENQKERFAILGLHSKLEAIQREVEE